MALQVVGVSLEMIAAVRPLVQRIRRHDRSLADQLVRAASRVALTRAAIRVAVAWGYFVPWEAEGAEELVRRVLAMLWKLTR